MKKYHFSLAVTLVIAALLVTGSPILLIGLDVEGTIPSGSFLTWLGVISFPLTLFWGFSLLRKPTDRFLKVLSALLKVSIALSVLWVPISYILAGNISFNFSEKTTFQGGFIAMQWFWRYSYSIVILPFAILVGYGLHAMASKLRS